MKKIWFDRISLPFCVDLFHNSFNYFQPTYNNILLSAQHDNCIRHYKKQRRKVLNNNNNTVLTLI